MYIDVVIPVVNLSKGIYHCLSSLEHISEVIRTVIVINQSGSALEFTTNYNLKVFDVARVSASKARNMGASLTTAEYVFFIDDDAFILTVLKKDLINCIMSKPDIISVKRWDVGIDEKIQPTIYNIPKFFIEWNIIIKRQVFLAIDGFPDIGVGSEHAAQSGEAFILIARAIKEYDASIIYLSSMEVIHPSLNINLRSEKAKGYLFGLGYSIGLTLKHMTLFERMYWFARMLVGFSKRAYQELFSDQYKSEPFKFYACKIIVGFFCGIRESQNID